MNTRALKLLFVCLQLTIIVVQARGQTASAVAIERVTPPSPEAAALGKSGTVPVGLFTGTPNIGIELYRLKTKNLELPITLNYSSNGIKVDEIPSRVGMSWVLNAGGVVTRTIYDKPDDKYARAGAPPSTDFNAQSPDPNLVSWVENISAGQQDTQFDEYSFSFNGYSGKFIIDLNNNPVLIPYSNLKVEVNLTSNVWNFRITTPDGIKYYFGASESTLTGSGSCSRNDSRGASSSWFLTRIENPNDPSDFITLTYNTTTYSFTSHITHTITYWDPANVCGVSIDPVTGNDNSCGCGPTPCIYGAPGGANDFGTDKFCISQNIYNGVYLNEITSSLYGKIHFSYISKPGVNTGNDYLMNSMQVYQNNDGTGLLKAVNLDYTMASPLPGPPNIYYQNNPSAAPVSPRPFLTSMQELDKNGAVIKTHGFEYNDINNLPPRLSFAQDYYGYYNGSGNYYSFIPLPEQYGNMLPPSKVADRNPNYTYAAKGVLTKVNFPTGGYVQLVWEGNSPQQTPTSLASSGGGLRVKQQIIYDPSSLQTTTTNYQYVGMIIPFSPTYFNRITSKQGQYLAGQTPAGAPTCNYDCSASNVSCSYIQFSSNSSVNLYGRGNSLVYYTSVTESIGDNFITGGIEHTYTYENYPGFNILHGNVIPNAVVPSYNWKNGLEVTRNIFKMVGGVKVYLKKTTNTYTDDSRVGQVFTQYVIRNNGSTPSTPYCTDAYGYYKRMDFFDVMSYPLTQQWRYLSSSQVEERDQDGINSIITVTNYFYDNPIHSQLTRTESQNSKGQLMQTIKKYPGDNATITNLNATETDAINKLIVQNNISPVLESEQYVNGNLTTRLHTGYNDWGNGILKPQIIKEQVQNNNIESRVKFQQYDSTGNLLQQSKANDLNTSYIWDYKLSYPIAEVKNASVSNTAYTSFESSGNGNWQGVITGNIQTAISAPTGNKYYTFFGSTLSADGLDGSIKYTVSYWSNAGPCTITGTTSTLSGRKSGNWTYYEHEVAGGSNVTVTGSGSIDELRLYPKSAQMTTYTYDPLVGMTSICDMASKIIYYEYDGFGRLHIVRDGDRNIVKEFCYNYKGDYAGCPVVFVNAKQSGNFTRNNCAAGITGSTVTYTVSASTYSSTVSQADANQKAINDVNTNGQIYANTNGTCTAVVATTYYNTVQSGSFTRNNCAAGTAGSTVTYTVAAGTYSSTVSQADANQKAINDVNTNGQTYANTNGTCTSAVVTTYYNAVQSGSFTRNNCAAGGTGSTVTYTIVAGTYTSTVSQADADQKAISDVNTNGQTYANTNGVCTFYSAVQSGSFQKNNCPNGAIGSTVMYTVAAGTYSSTISQADADQKAMNDVNTNGQTYANTNGTCADTTLINVKYTNITPDDVYLTMTMTNTSANVVYKFTLRGNTPSLTVAGQVPNGTYNVTMTPISGTGPYSYGFYTFSASGVAYADFYNVPLCATCAVATVTTH
ncbi:DUF5977 domain-containing protein [Asinibacterium sp. OR53]|uniref:DUF5977 domain-containing protein n=1 Tax=Asinibacterium sp. OR53 TaxID=925409 RepID=UPI00056327FB|nr:DUF5977 domain-containing protein [Asinibacterium sp. OR53]